MTDAPGSDPRAERRRKKRERRKAAPEQSAGPGPKAQRRERNQLRDLDAQEERGPLIAFVHIPKTAGGTVKSVFADAFGRGAVSDSGNYLRNPEPAAAQSFQFNPRVRVTIGHVPYGLYRPHLPPDTRYITFLREPVERVISHYYRHLDGKVGTRTLAEALEGGTPAVTNLLTRFLCGRGHPELLGTLPDTAVEEAKAALETFFFVGFQDRFDESLVLLQDRLGMPITAYGASRHVNAERPSFEELGDENLALIARHNQLDVELYAWARDRFGGDFEARRDELAGAVETLRGAVTEKVAEQEEHVARARQWLAEQVPPGTQRPFKELRAEAEKVGLTTRDVQRARRQMNPPSRKIKTDRGVMLAVASVAEAVDHSTRKAAKKKQRIEMAASPEARAATAAAVQWLQEQLPHGTSRRITEVLEAAAQAGVPDDAVRRAAQELGFRRSLDEADHKVWTAGDVSDSAVRSGAHE